MPADEQRDAGLRSTLARTGIPRVDAEGREVGIHAGATPSAAAMRQRRGPGPLPALLGYSDLKVTYTLLDVEDSRGAIEPRWGGDGRQGRSASSRGPRP